MDSNDRKFLVFVIILIAILVVLVTGHLKEDEKQYLINLLIFMIGLYIDPKKNKLNELMRSLSSRSNSSNNSDNKENPSEKVDTVVFET